MLCTEILIQEMVKYFMGLPFSVIRLSTPDNGVKLQITVHIMVYSECAEFDIFPCQKYPHTAIPVYSVVFVIYFRYFIKSSLFLSAGMVIYFRLSRFNYHYVDQLRGVGKDLPVVMIGFTVASLSLVGVPPTGGFVSKWYLAMGALPPDLGWLGLAGVIVLLVSAVLTAGYLLPVVTSAFFPGKDYDEDAIEPMLSRPPSNMRTPVVLLSAAALLTGVFAGPLIRYFGRFASTVL